MVLLQQTSHLTLREEWHLISLGSDYESKMVFKVNIATNFISLLIAPTNAYNPKITTTLFATGPFHLAIDNNRNKLYISNFGGLGNSNILVVS